MVKKAIDIMDDKIKRNGYTVIGVMEGENEPSFAYTVGLLETYGHPELITFGLPANTASLLFKNAVEKIIENQGAIREHIPYDQVASVAVEFIKTDIQKTLKYMVGFNDRYGYDKEISAMQLLWPDKQGHFPYEKEFDQSFLNSQPLLGAV